MASTVAGRCGWATVAGIVGFSSVLCGAAGVYLLARGEFRAVAGLPVSLLFGYWVTVGAWRRTGWSRHTPTADELAAPGTLSPVHAARWTLWAVACVIALVLALGIQVAAGRA